MKEHPIIFSSEMVKAILEGRKTMTRRVVKPQPESSEFIRWDLDFDWRYKGEGISLNRESMPKYCPYGQVGDRLWVRETWCQDLDTNCITKHIVYKASAHPQAGFTWKPSIFMPRWASRITLEITNIRVERLQEITQDDAFKECMTRELAIQLGLSVSPSEEEFNLTQARRIFIELWNSINAKRGYSWESNPWVWVIEFKRVEIKYTCVA